MLSWLCRREAGRPWPPAPAPAPQERGALAPPLWRCAEAGSPGGAPKYRRPTAVQAASENRRGDRGSRRIRGAERRAAAAITTQCTAPAHCRHTARRASHRAPLSRSDTRGAAPRRHHRAPPPPAARRARPPPPPDHADAAEPARAHAPPAPPPPRGPRPAAGVAERAPPDRTGPPALGRLRRERVWVPMLCYMVVNVDTYVSYKLYTCVP